MNKGVFLLPAALFVFLLHGCASTRQSRELELQSLRNQITVLESQIQSREQEISSLKEELAKPAPASKRLKIDKAKAEVKNIQTALRNAKFYSGPVDGGMGPETRQAVVSFQKANKLHPDGRVGRKTWKLLKNYL
jgi:peptidoglycan hydrolase-like protein with peptidoglycan-binding domain